MILKSFQVHLKLKQTKKAFNQQKKSKEYKIQLGAFVRLENANKFLKK